ncbi:hypothetical protein [Pseudonocardia sp.]|jgi:hypothetical protein|uniref:hypothetical protein n=1 Tax=Pseudonocardia sp. TaxID=60912 RepID=UPI00261A37EE|nr:hypothetical protein [Pseudonocardia sp.]
MLPITRLYADEHGHARPGDVLLVEDTAGVGHSNRSSEGFAAAFVLLEPSPAVL